MRCSLSLLLPSTLMLPVLPMQAMVQATLPFACMHLLLCMHAYAQRACAGHPLMHAGRLCVCVCVCVRVLPGQ